MDRHVFLAIQYSDSSQDITGVILPVTGYTSHFDCYRGTVPANGLRLSFIHIQTWMHRPGANNQQSWPSKRTCMPLCPLSMTGEHSFLQQHDIFRLWRICQQFDIERGRCLENDPASFTSLLEATTIFFSVTYAAWLARTFLWNKAVIEDVNIILSTLRTTYLARLEMLCVQQYQRVRL